MLSPQWDDTACGGNDANGAGEAISGDNGSDCDHFQKSTSSQRLQLSHSLQNQLIRPPLGPPSPPSGLHSLTTAEFDARNKTRKDIPLMITGNAKVDAALRWKRLLSSAQGPPITIINNYDTDGPPTDFLYTDERIFGENVPRPNIMFLDGCSCKSSEGCWDESCLCTDFNTLPAYDSSGCVLLSPKSLIYECNTKCACPPSCINRVVQHGVRIPMSIIKTKNRGWGVVTNVDVAANSFIVSYVGEVITSDVAEVRGFQYDQIGKTYLFDLDYITKENESPEFTIDAYHYGNISHFLNHSCEPNLNLYIVLIDNLDTRMPELALFSAVDIKAGTELTFDYSGGLRGEKVEKVRKKCANDMMMKCLCGSENCRNWLPL